MKKQPIWTEKQIDDEIEELKTRDDDLITVVSRGPTNTIIKNFKKATTRKTNLDLPEDIVEKLDEIARETASTRQAVIKLFIVNGFKDYYQTKINELNWRKETLQKKA